LLGLRVAEDPPMAEHPVRQHPDRNSPGENNTVTLSICWLMRDGQSPTA
jgi:hypothetical protein